MDSASAIERIAQAVAAKVSPTAAEAAREKEFADALIAKLAKALPEATLMLVGSTARDTGLSGDKDLDVFAAFSRDQEEDAIVKRTVSAVKKAVPAKWEMHYAEHPYLQADVSGYAVEVIPCFRLEKGQKLKSAVDRTPLHMRYLQEKMSPAQRMDVRALKRLLKSHGLYGAEQRVKGFSGLLCEYLILNYRSLSGLVAAVRDWKPPVMIDFVRTYKKFDAPLVFIDAVDDGRNVAAVVSKTQLHRLISLCQTLFEKPSEKLFFPAKPKTVSAAFLQKRLDGRGTSWRVLAMKRPDVVEDILWPQLERTAANLKKQWTLAGFSVFGEHAFLDEKKAYLFLEVEHAVLPMVRRTMGPPVARTQNVREFIRGKRPLRGPYIKDERVFVEERRAETNAWAFLERIRRHPRRFGVASHLEAAFRKTKAIARVSQLSKEGRTELAAHALYAEAWWQ